MDKLRKSLNLKYPITNKKSENYGTTYGIKHFYICYSLFFNFQTPVYTQKIVEKQKK